MKHWYHLLLELLSNSMPAIVLVITVSFDVPLLTLDYAPAPIFTEKENESYTVQ